MCPCVSSPAGPLRNQNTFFTPEAPERPVVLRPGQAGIANLDFGMQITFLGGKQRATAVHLDAAAFDDKRPAIKLRAEKPFAQPVRRHFRHFAVLLPVIMFRPGVEMKMDDGGIGC